MLYAFPYLDLIIAVTWWNEGPWGDETVSEEEFCKEVAVGIYVHGRKLEILNPSDTIAKYTEYNKCYGTPPEKFEREYYERHKIEQVNLEKEIRKMNNPFIDVFCPHCGEFVNPIYEGDCPNCGEYIGSDDNEEWDDESDKDEEWDDEDDEDEEWEGEDDEDEEWNDEDDIDDEE